VKGREKRKGGEKGQGQREARKKLTEMKIKWSDEKRKGKYIIEMEKGRRNVKKGKKRTGGVAPFMKWVYK
jgi:hypothetical protein